jgi:agmatine/peptidylarginine deiminase
MSDIVFPAEWEPQSGVQLTWPHENTDWVSDMNAVVDCFVSIAKEIIKRELLIVVTPDADTVRKQ